MAWRLLFPDAEERAARRAEREARWRALSEDPERLRRDVRAMTLVVAMGCLLLGAWLGVHAPKSPPSVAAASSQCGQAGQTK